MTTHSSSASRFVTVNGKIAPTNKFLFGIRRRHGCPVTHFHIRPGKFEEFVATAQSLIPAVDKLSGLRALLVLRGEEKDSRDAMAISVWDSAADLKNSDNDAFYYDVLARMLNCCEGFSPMRHEQEVLISKFANP